MIPFRVSNKGCPVPGSSDRCILISFTPRIGPIQGASVMDTLKWLLESSPYFFSNFSFDFTAFRYADFGIRFPKISVFCRNVLNTEETARSFLLRAVSCQKITHDMVYLQSLHMSNPGLKASKFLLSILSCVIRSASPNLWK